MEYTEVYGNTMLRGTDENGVYTESKYILKENGDNDVEATKQKIIDQYNLVKQLAAV